MTRHHVRRSALALDLAVGSAWSAQIGLIRALADWIGSPSKLQGTDVMRHFCHG